MKKYRSLYESLRDAFVLVDLQGRTFECNQPYLDMIGYSLEELRTLVHQELTLGQWHEAEAWIVRKQLVLDAEARRTWEDRREK